MPHTNAAAEWLLTIGYTLPTASELLTGLCIQLDNAGLELVRCTARVPSLHPEVPVQLFVWRESPAPFELAVEQGVIGSRVAKAQHGVVETVDLAYAAYEGPQYTSSPIHRIIGEGHSIVRCRINPDDTTYEYPILKDLQSQGARGYLALAANMGGGRGAGSFATRKRDGFTDADVAMLQEMMVAYALCFERHASRRLAEALVSTYLGAHAGERVLRGRIRRGDVERMQAAIWFSDLRGFTRTSESVDSSVLISWLNEYFGAVAGPIENHGGQILKFIGDAVLAVFPIEDAEPAIACRRALSAARAANQALDELNADRNKRSVPALEHGIGLHVGEVQYGNIGTQRRLDFTVIGQAVNLASRLEGLCANLGRRLVVSGPMRVLLTDEPLESLGTFELKGIKGAQPVFADKT